LVYRPIVLAASSTSQRACVRARMASCMLPRDGCFSGVQRLLLALYRRLPLQLLALAVGDGLGPL